MQVTYTWDEDSGTASCTIIDKEGHKFQGFANCHDKDNDMKNEYTGKQIAEYRAYIHYLQYYKNCELYPQQKILKHLYNTMKDSHNFNPKGYEAIMLYRKMREVDENILLTKHSIEELKQALRTYILNKEMLYQTIRKHRSQQS